MAVAQTRTSSPAAGAPSRTLARLIVDRCEQAALPLGSRLPTERALSTELGVTRAAIRNALALLEADGRVSREVGRGTFLRSLPEDTGDGHARSALGAEPDDVGPIDVMAARQLIEPRVLPLVVASATTRDFEQMERCLQGGESAERAEEFEAWDFALHHAIVVASHNPLLLRMYAQIEEARGGALWGNLKRRNDTSERRRAYQRDHREIVAALRARELERALEAMDVHLERVRSNLLQAAG
ncbi:MAG: FadR/GntR family transcriptional regulator [Gaiellaceae bacterium]